MQAGAAPSWAPCSAPALGSVRSRIAQTDVPALHLLWIVLKEGDSGKETFCSLGMQRDEKSRNSFVCVKPTRPHFLLLCSLHTAEIERNLHGRRPRCFYQIHIRIASYAREILQWTVSTKQ